MAHPTRYTTEQFKKSLAQEHDALGDGVLVKDFAPEIIPAEDGASRIVQFVISTGSVDRDGDTIDPNGWELDSFQKAGSILWGHDSYAPPIAESLAVWVEDNKLKARCRFPTRDVYDFSDTIYRLILANVIKATSVGFKPLSWTETNERAGNWGPALDFKTQSLLEYSVVSVPANPEALVEAKSLGIDMGPYLKWAEKTLDTMAESGFLVPRNDLERAYFGVKATTAVTVPEEIKAGRVLSTKNLDRLTSAMDAIQEVIDSAGSVEDEESLDEDKTAEPVETKAESDTGEDADVIDLAELQAFLKPKKTVDEESSGSLRQLIGSIVSDAFKQARGQ